METNLTETIARLQDEATRAGPARLSLNCVIDALALLRAGNVSQTRTVSTEPPTGVPADGDEWIVV